MRDSIRANAYVVTTALGMAPSMPAFAADAPANSGASSAGDIIVTNQHYYTWVPGFLGDGYDFASIGAPRMFGARAMVHF